MDNQLFVIVIFQANMPNILSVLYNRNLNICWSNIMRHQYTLPRAFYLFYRLNNYLIYNENKSDDNSYSCYYIFFSNLLTNLTSDWSSNVCRRQ